MRDALGRWARRDRIILALLLLLAAAAAGTDILLLPETTLPTIVYAVPILMAAYLLSPRQTVLVASWSLGLEVVEELIQPIAPWLFSLYALGVLAITYLALSLATKNRQTAHLLDEVTLERRRLSAVLDQMPAGVIIAEAPSAKIVLGNHQVEKTLGHPFFYSQDIEGYANYKGFHPDGRPYEPEEWPIVRSLLTGEVVTNEEIDFLCTDSTLRAISVSSAPIRGHRGCIGAAVAIFSDISARKRAEDELRTSEERYHALFSSISDGFAICEVKYGENGEPCGHRLLDINPAGEGLLGGSREDLLGKRSHEIPPAIEKSAVRAFREAALTGKQIKIETYNQELGKWLDILAFSPRKGLVGVLFKDISERKRHDAERERLLQQIGQLAEMSQRRAVQLEAILDNMVDSVFVCDRRGRITLANHSGVRLLGLSSLEELRSALSRFPDFLEMRLPDGTALQSRETPLVQALAGNTVTNFEQLIVNQKTGRDVYVRTSAAPIRDDNGNITGAVAVSRDITDLTELDRIKEQFIAVAAHELKTPVAIMKGYAQALLRKNEEVSPASQRMLNAIDRGADRIAGIVRDLLDISRLHDGSLELESERLDLLQMLDEVVGRMDHKTVGHSIHLRRNGPVLVVGDRDRLEQVASDLLDNAMRYSPDGGDIEIEVTAFGDNAVMSIRDQGVGIPKAKQGRIFERFYRAHTGTPYDYGGMGVGLYICREIASKHGGRIWFESDEGKGSTFYLSLPLAS